MKATNLDLMKLSAAFDGEFNLADFTPDEIDEMLGLLQSGATAEQIREKYFEFYDDIKDRVLDTGFKLRNTVLQFAFSFVTYLCVCAPANPHCVLSCKRCNANLCRIKLKKAARALP